MSTDKILIIVALMGLSACGKAPLIIPSDVQPQVDRFISDALRFQPSFSIDRGLEIKMIPGYDGAACNPNDNGHPTIMINSDPHTGWPMWDQDMKEIIIYREMGFCVLQQAPRDDGTPFSIMTKTADFPKGLDYDIYHEKYLTELFTHKAWFE